MKNAKVSVNVWNRYSESEKELFRRLIPLACSVNEIKSFITAIKKRFGTVEGITLHKMDCLVIDGRLSFWNQDSKRWTDTQISPNA